MWLPSWILPVRRIWLFLVANLLLLQQTMEPAVVGGQLTEAPTSTLPVAQNDTVLSGINTIVSLVEGITNAVGTSLEHLAADERTMVRSRAHNPGQQILKGSAEYEAFNCGFTCFIRAPNTDTEQDVLRRFSSKLAGENAAVIDCFHSQKFDGVNNKLKAIPLTVKCVSHYTGRVIHVIISFKKSLREKSRLQSAILASKFSENLVSVIKDNLPPNHPELTNLYLTLDLPLLQIEADSINPLGPWLHYLAVDGQDLQAVDALLLRNLTLDYFVLEGCQLLEERIFDRPNEFVLNDLSSVELRQLFNNCMLVWAYACPELGVFDIVADHKAQQRACTHEISERTEQTPYGTAAPQLSAPGPLEAYHHIPSPVTTFSPRRHTTRRHRSILVETEAPPQENIFNTYSKEAINNYREPVDWLPVVERLVSGFKDDLKLLSSDVRRDITWYQKTLNILIAIVITLILALVAIALAFYLTVRQLLVHDKRHCPKAIM